MRNDELGATATDFLLRAVRHFRKSGVRIRAVLTDNGGALSLQSLQGRLPLARHHASLHAALSSPHAVALMLDLEDMI